MSSREEKRYLNETHRQWLEHPTTRAMLEKLDKLERPNATDVRGLDGEREFLAKALWRSGVDEAIKQISTVPYPAVEV